MKVKVSKNELECSYNSKIVCPFCGYEDEDVERNCVDESPQEIECESCGRTFIVSGQIEITYSTAPKDVKPLNDWKRGEFHEDGCETQEDEDFCNKIYFCEQES